MPNELRVLVRDEGYDVAVLVNGHYLEGGRFPHLMKWKDGKTAWDMAALQVLKLGAERVTLCPNDSSDDEGLKHIKLLNRMDS